MENPKQMFALYDSDGEVHSITPYSANAEQTAAREGLTLKVFKSGSKGYEACLRAWHLYLDKSGFGQVQANLDQAPETSPGSPPLPPAADDCEAQARREWDKDPSLKAEFGELACYLAWKRVEASGQARVFKGNL